MPHSQSIRVCAVVLFNDDGRVALVRKRNTEAFMFPGGKPEPNEDGVTTAVREVHEELGVELAAQQLKHLGSFTTQAANEADTQLFSRVYTALLPSSETVTAQAEIVELLWVVPGAVTLSPGTRLAPLASMILGQVADAPR